MRVESHCKYLKSKVGVFFNKLGKLAKSQWGLKCRTFYNLPGNVHPDGMRPGGWVDLCTVKDKKVLKAVQREVLIAHTSTYRTASWELFCVVQDKTPIDLLDLSAEYMR